MYAHFSLSDKPAKNQNIVRIRQVDFTYHEIKGERVEDARPIIRFAKHLRISENNQVCLLMRTSKNISLKFKQAPTPILILFPNIVKKRLEFSGGNAFY